MLPGPFLKFSEGTRLSEPHTSEFRCGFSYIYISGIHHSVCSSLLPHQTRRTFLLYVTWRRHKLVVRVVAPGVHLTREEPAVAGEEAWLACTRPARGDHTSASNNSGKSMLHSSHLYTHTQFSNTSCVGGGGERAWYTLFTHVPSSLGNLHSNALEIRDGITFNFYMGLPHNYSIWLPFTVAGMTTRQQASRCQIFHM